MSLLKIILHSSPAFSSAFIIPVIRISVKSFVSALSVYRVIFAYLDYPTCCAYLVSPICFIFPGYRRTPVSRITRPAPLTAVSLRNRSDAAAASQPEHRPGNSVRPVNRITPVHRTEPAGSRILPSSVRNSTRQNISLLFPFTLPDRKTESRIAEPVIQVIRPCRNSPAVSVNCHVLITRYYLFSLDYLICSDY